MSLQTFLGNGPFWSFFVAADLAEMLPPVNFVVARRCRRRVKSGCAALSLKKFLCISPRAPSSFLYLFLFRFLLRLTSFFLLHEKTMVCLTNLKEKKNSKSWMQTFHPKPFWRFIFSNAACRKISLIVTLPYLAKSYLPSMWKICPDK